MGTDHRAFMSSGPTSIPAYLPVLRETAAEMLGSSLHVKIPRVDCAHKEVRYTAIL